MSLSGRTALLTGATGGLGQAIARELAAQGCRLLLTGRSDAKLKELCAGLEADGHQATPIAADLGDDQSLQQLVQAAAAVGEVEVLINCAGLFPVSPIAETTLEEFDRCLAVNLRAPFVLCRAFLPGMVARRWGRVVNVGSSSAFSGFRNTSIYCASKHGLLGLTRALFDEMRSHNVRVISINPGSIQTEMGMRVPGQDFSTFLDPVDVARHLVFVASSDSQLVSEEVRLNRIIIR